MTGLVERFRRDAENIPNVKIVVWGTGNAGKTSLLKIYSLLLKLSRPQAVVSDMTQVKNPFEETALFDQSIFGIGRKTREDRELPVLKYNLYTVAGQERYRDSRKVVLKGVDGLILMLDPENPKGNFNSLQELKGYLGSKGIRNIPWIVAINKCDLGEIPSEEDLLRPLVELGYVEELSELGDRTYWISALRGRDALVEMLTKDQETFVDSQGHLRSEMFPDEVRDIVTMVNDLTAMTIRSKVK